MATLSELAVSLGRVISTSLKGVSNAVLANLISLEGVEDDADGETSGDEPMYASLGIYGRPAPPIKTGSGSGNTPDGSAEYIGLRVGDRVYPIAYRDLRLLAKVNPKEGEVGLVQYQGGFISLKENDDGDGTSIQIYAVRNTSAGVPDKASVINIDTKRGNESISMVHENGQSMTMNNVGGTVIMNKAGDAYVEVNDDGVTINAAVTAITGAAHIGDSNPAATEFLVKSVNLLAWIGEVNTALGLLVGHVHTGVTTGVGSTGTPAAPPVAPTTVPAATTKLKGI